MYIINVHSSMYIIITHTHTHTHTRPRTSSHDIQVSGQVLMKLTMPGVLSWVLGGNAEQLSTEDRAPSCRLSDKPRGFDESQFPLLMRDDDALLRASRAHWLLQPVPPAVLTGLPIQLPAVEISGCPSILVGSADNCHVVVDCPAVCVVGGGYGLLLTATHQYLCYLMLLQVAKNHAIIEQVNGDYFVCDLVRGGVRWSWYLHTCISRDVDHHQPHNT